MFAEQPAERLLVSIDNRLCRVIERVSRVRQLVEMRRELGPALKPVASSDHELRVGEGAAALSAGQRAKRELLDLVRRAIALARAVPGE